MTRGPARVTVERVTERDGFACVMCGRSILGRQRGLKWSLHHRRPRGMGGSKRPDTDCAANLLTVCGHGTAGCHGLIERHRADAMEMGLLLSQRDNPREKPVLIGAQSRWVYLTDSGEYSDEPPETRTT